MTIKIYLPFKLWNFFTGVYCKCGRKRKRYGWGQLLDCKRCWDKAMNEAVEQQKDKENSE